MALNLSINKILLCKTNNKKYHPHCQLFGCSMNNIRSIADSFAATNAPHQTIVSPLLSLTEKASCVFLNTKIMNYSVYSK